MKKRVALSLLLALVLMAGLLTLTTGPTAEAAGYVYVTVQPGDHLASIARAYCTTWQAIYDLNRDIIGPDPDHLVPGMVLTVPAGCNGSGGSCAGVYDRGWLPHAQGSVIPPNHYLVAKGDTWYSIGKRFGVSVAALRQTNGQYYPYAFTVATIPCLNASPTPTPSPYPTLTPTPTPTPVLTPTPTPTPPPVDYPAGQCSVLVNVNTNAYDAPNGAILGHFSGDGTFEANRREHVNGEYWYRLPIQVGDNPAIWVRAGELSGVSAGCGSSP